MSTYRITWDCCGDTTETESWEPSSCPFCRIHRLEVALADAIRRPLGVIPDSAEGLLHPTALVAAEERSKK